MRYFKHTEDGDGRPWQEVSFGELAEDGSAVAMKVTFSSYPTVRRVEMRLGQDELTRLSHGTDGWERIAGGEYASALSVIHDYVKTINAARLSLQSLIIF